MKYLALLFLFPLFTLSALDPKGDQLLKEIRSRFAGPTVRILLQDEADGALVEVKGPYNAYDPKTGSRVETAFRPSSYYMYPTVEGLKWGSEFPGVYQILLVPDNLNTTVMVAGTEYRGMAYMYQIKGTLGAVNELSLDDFVASILSSHVPSYVTEKEAISALAIALRTEVWSIVQQKQNPYWDLTAGTFGYRGSTVERSDRDFTQAITMTKAMVLTKNGQLVDINWFKAGKDTAPYREMQTWAEKGKDAKEILEALFPLSKISSIAS